MLVLSLFFIPTTLYSNEYKSTLEEIQLAHPFWENMRQTLDTEHIIKTYNSQKIIKEVSNNYAVLSSLLAQKIFQDHFFAKFQDALYKKEQLNPEKYMKIFHLLADFSDTLKERPIEKINSFMLRHNFTQTDKLLTMLVLLFNKNLGEESWDWMEALDLSVNDTLVVKNINSLLITEDLKDSNNVITTLAHHLAGTGDSTTLRNLFDANYDPKIKNHIKENILHSFLRLNNLRRQHGHQINSNYMEAFDLLAEYSQQIIDERDMLGLTPLAVAVNTNDKSAVKVLLTKGVDLQTTDILGRDLKDLAALHKDRKLFDYLKDRIPLEQEQQKIHSKDILSFNKNRKTAKRNLNLIYLDFEPFINSLISSVALANTDISNQNLNNFYLTIVNKLKYAESTRLKALINFLYFNRTQFVQKLKPIFHAIFNKDSHFFQNLTEEQKKLLAIITVDSLNGETVLLTNFLLESIRYSFLPAVKYMLENYEISRFANKDIVSLSFDPLSLSLLTYVSLEREHPSKKEAGKIIRMVADHVDAEKSYPFFINFSPMTLAILLGLLEEVKFLHEEKGAKLTTDFYDEHKNWILDVLDYTKSRGFMLLNHYLHDKRGLPACQKVFLH